MNDNIFTEINDGELVGDHAKWYQYCDGVVDEDWFLRFICNNPSFSIPHEAWIDNAPINVINRQDAMIKYLNGRILDVGCNTGVFVSKLRQLQKDVHGVDGSSIFIRIAKAYAKLFKDDTSRYKLGLIQDIPHEDSAFDTVHAQEIIEHLPNTDVAIQEVKRVLKSNGRFCGSVPYKEDPHHHPGHFNYFDEVVVRNMLESHGFVIEALFVEGSKKKAKGGSISKNDSAQLLWVARMKK